MTRLTELLGRTTVSLDTAERTGEVRRVAVRDQRIAALDIGDRLVSGAAVRSYDGDVVTHEDRPDDDGLRQLDLGRTLGARVLDTGGDELGTLVDLDIGPVGEVMALVLDDGRRIDGRRLRAVGAYAAVVDGESDARAPDVHT